ncbi:Tautomerase/MIF superfamily [Talaromyces proteolyticus]|uniref:Tautomerase/MIF superfamily n=1 Tax=Talaromyces proteolyticus TaxID=1131652 RepID=A0AAD4PVE4_9EURO|nr:Tautomerase/MIF superfamily [Talaromyces proteolyticus]KAH8696425.1 Tautomerase/MIF superfamily [Talaromyces proteolyticus]
MPLVKIDLIKGVRTREGIQKLSATIQQVMIESFSAPKQDRYQIITQHEDYEIICEDSGLGYSRSNQLVIIQIFQQGRDQQQKKDVYKALQKSLHSECGVSGDDLIVTCVENSRADWSFGMGEAQFLTRQL